MCRFRCWQLIHCQDTKVAENVETEGIFILRVAKTPRQVDTRQGFREKDPSPRSGGCIPHNSRFHRRIKLMSGEAAVQDLRKRLRSLRFSTFVITTDKPAYHIVESGYSQLQFFCDRRIVWVECSWRCSPLGIGSMEV